MHGVPRDAKSTRFMLAFRPEQNSHKLDVEASGCVRFARPVGGGEAQLAFPWPGHRLAWEETDGSWTLESLMRNQVPIYVRRCNGGVARISNDLLLLIDHGEEVELSALTLVSVLTGSVRSVFQNLFTDIELLLPTSTYRIHSSKGHAEVNLTDVAFAEQPESTSEMVLEQLVETYREAMRVPST